MTLDKLPMRDGYGKALLKLCAENKNIMVLDADVSKSTRTVWVHEQYPDKFLNMGISEQDMVGTAAGLALSGITAFASTYGVFLSGRAWDEIRTTVCYNNLNVKLGGAHAGISVGPDGATHQALEDIALMRVLPNMTVIAPCDAIETEKATLAAAEKNGPCYLRFGREPVPIITNENTEFKIGKANVLRTGKDAAVIACGAEVYESMKAAEMLSNQNINISVVNMHTIKPLDEDCIMNMAQLCGCIVTAEEHQAYCGLGSAVAECVVQNCPTPMEMVAVKDTFGESGKPDELIREYELDSTAIVKAVKKAIMRKS